MAPPYLEITSGFSLFAYQVKHGTLPPGFRTTQIKPTYNVEDVMPSASQIITTQTKLRNGTNVTTRALSLPQDYDNYEIFFENLSSRSIETRYFGPRFLHQLTQINDNHIVLISIDESCGKIIGELDLALVFFDHKKDIHLGVVVSDGIQGNGLGTYLISLAENISIQLKATKLHAKVRPCNTPMIKVFEHNKYVRAQETQNEICFEKNLASQ